MSKSATPKHVAIIMDGNGRWAEAHGQERIYGHRTGAKVVRDITTHAAAQGVRYLTLYAFSHENWRRPEDEVQGLMRLLWEYLKTEKATLLKNRIELRMIGNAHKLPLTVRTLLSSVQKATQGLSRMRLTLALSYGGQDELIRAVKQIAKKVKAGTVLPDDITPALLEDHLDTRDMPPPDLVIRTSGEQRLSNFLPWQSAYSELYFTEVTWPAFTTADFDTALETYASRERRYGALTPSPTTAAQGS